VTANLAYRSTIVAHTCGECSIVFGVPDGFLEERQRDGRTFYCPNGHQRVYRETEAQKLQKQLTQAQQDARFARSSRDAWRDQAEAAERSKRAVRGHLTRLRNRVAAGNCPVDNCGRHFADLGAHIRADHAELVEL
jgi:uncharacterized Zn finger protein (UPF0148 family)